MGASGRQLSGAGGKSVVLFWRSLDDFERSHRGPGYFWDKYRGQKHKSSLIGLEEDVRQSLSRARMLSAGTIIALLLALFMGIFPWVSGLYIDSTRRVDALENRVDLLTATLSEEDRQSRQTGQADAEVAEPATQRTTE